ncbi:MAG: nucleoside triphosphate pyrophosphohydrolase [Candidatus Promineofilum sp.]|mgnify:CR=1 FL=1|nr:nucleoside triphosphate pyrophosphohydrolase [Promineifilum sp.]MCW5863778.1 nucleoside triphosphate pyrophosphohydrolase [Anaerolineae bacterium]
MTITIVGLGPGDAGLITRQAWHLLSAAEAVTLRTRRHPAVAGLPAHLHLRSFDDIYDTAEDFGAVYQRIADEVLRLGRAGEVVYAVPGHPFVGEATVTAIARGAAEAGIPVEIIAGLSFVEPTLAALGIDALDGLQLFDAIELAGYLYPPINPDVPVLLGQVYSRLLAGELKAALMSIYPPEQPVALVHAAGEAEQRVEHLALHEFDRSEHIDHLTSLYVPALPVKAGLTALAETVAVLRSPDGCPWDQEQTSQSLREGFLEEAYEALAAIDAEDDANLREELGDLLYHIVMQTQIAAEADSFTLTEVITGIEAKLKRRHPHVWGDWQVSSSADVLRNWEILKQREKDDAGATVASVLDGIPPALPALARSQKIQGRAANTGFDWPDIEGVFDKLAEEVAEVRAAATADEKRAELGDVLFVVVNLARWLGVDAETALREANERFMARFRGVEGLAAERELNLSSLSFAALDDLWREAKAALAQSDVADSITGEPE